MICKCKSHFYPGLLFSNHIPNYSSRILRAYEKKEVGWAAAEMKQNFKLALQSKKGLQAEKYMRDLLILSQVLVNDKHWLVYRNERSFYNNSYKEED